MFGVIFDDVFGTIFGSLGNLSEFSWEDNCRTFIPYSIAGSPKGFFCSNWKQFQDKSSEFLDR